VVVLGRGDEKGACLCDGLLECLNRLGVTLCLHVCVEEWDPRDPVKYPDFHLGRGKLRGG